MRQTQKDTDIIIIGGGPGGAAMAGYLRKAGINCMVLEREHFPREHVGESLVPASNKVLNDLGLMEEMENQGFVRKYGAAWSTHEGRNIYEHDWEDKLHDADILFYEGQDIGDHKKYTYHVDRGKFDKMLLDHARNQGAQVFEGSKVSSIEFLADGVVVSGTREEEGFEHRAHMVVDASGRHTMLGNQLGLKVKDPVFQQCALHTWYSGFERGDSDKADYIVVHFLPISNSWIWQIPITEDITSFGVVTQNKNFVKRKEDHEAFFEEMISSKPDLYKRIKKAKRLRPFKAEGDYSYKMTQFAGDRFILIGDAARFVDPIFSSGVSIALNSARFGSEDVIRAVKSGNYTRSAFSNYEQTLTRGSNNWYQFISLYYRLNVLFTYFVNNKKYRADILKLLQGDVYDEETPSVLEEMRQIVTEVEQNEDHVWHQLLGTLTAEAFKP